MKYLGAYLMAVLGGKDPWEPRALVAFWVMRMQGSTTYGFSLPKWMFTLFAGNRCSKVPRVSITLEGCNPEGILV